MDQLNLLFQLFPQYRIAVCRECCVGIIQSQVQAHLNAKHKHLHASIRGYIVAAALGVQEWAASIKEVVFPKPHCQPVHHLAVFKDGLKCTALVAESASCGYIRRTVQDIQKHCRKEHRWENPRKRGRVLNGR